VIEVFDRAGEPAMALGGYTAYFGTGSDLMSTYDLETGEHRASVLADVGRAARGSATPCPTSTSSCRRRTRATCPPQKLIRRELQGDGHEHDEADGGHLQGAADLRVMTEVAALLRRRRGRVAPRSPTSPCTPSRPARSVTPPTAWTSCCFCADAGVPVIYSPAPLAGGTAPITVAGHIAQGTAESLSASSSISSRRPGAPFIFGIGPAVLDMGTMQSTYNAPEYLSALVCAIEMARWLDLPNWGYGGTTDSQLGRRAGRHGDRRARAALSR
jgi:trimethylamine---corrinoid protein Co-methyltransferase